MDNQFNKIREQRKKLCYSIRELAKLTKISESKIKEYEAGQTIATLGTIEKIAKVTNTKAADWVSDQYFTQKAVKLKKANDGYCEIATPKQAHEIIIKAILDSDDTVEIVDEALIAMGEITKGKKEPHFTQFAEDVLLGVGKTKYEKIIKMVLNRINKKNQNATIKNSTAKGENAVERKAPFPLNVKYDWLLEDCKELSKHIDTYGTIIQVLIEHKYINEEGVCSEKAKILLNTLMENKIKSVIKNNSESPTSN